MGPEKCAYCGDLTDMPFHCNYCKDPFCAEHRLPEEHRCIKLSQIRARRFGERKVIRDGGPNKPSIFKRMFKKFKDWPDITSHVMQICNISTFWSVCEWKKASPNSALLLIWSSDLDIFITSDKFGDVLDSLETSKWVLVFSVWPLLPYLVLWVWWYALTSFVHSSAEFGEEPDKQTSYIFNYVK